MKGAPHTAKRSMINFCVSRVPPAPVYKGARGRQPAKGRGAPKGGGNPTPSRFAPSFLVLVGEGKERERTRRKEGVDPLALNQFGLGLGGELPTLPFLPSISTKAHVGPLSPPGGSGNPRSSGICQKPSGTFPNSEYSRPIYRSLRLDDFKTPRHVPDLIRDSEQTTVIKSHNS